jgi:hypothetical protein
VVYNRHILKIGVPDEAFYEHLEAVLEEKEEKLDEDASHTHTLFYSDTFFSQSL